VLITAYGPVVTTCWPRSDWMRTTDEKNRLTSRPEHQPVAGSQSNEACRLSQAGTSSLQWKRRGRAGDDPMQNQDQSKELQTPAAAACRLGACAHGAIQVEECERRHEYGGEYRHIEPEAENFNVPAAANKATALSRTNSAAWIWAETGITNSTCRTGPELSRTEQRSSWWR